MTKKSGENPLINLLNLVINSYLFWIAKILLFYATIVRDNDLIKRSKVSLDDVLNNRIKIDFSGDDYMKVSGYQKHVKYKTINAGKRNEKRVQDGIEWRWTTIEFFGDEYVQNGELTHLARKWLDDHEIMTGTAGLVGKETLKG